MDKIILETERLILREMTRADAAEVFALNNDPEVIRLTGDASFASVGAAELFLAQYRDYEKYVVGRWAVIRKEDNAWLGWCGLKWMSETEEVDLGYRLHRKYWNRGYASEAAAACIHYGFNTCHFQRIIGRVLKENAASVKVLEHMGMTKQLSQHFHGEEGWYYVINNPEL